MCISLSLANTIVQRGLVEQIEVTPMMLQKIVYFTYRDYLQEMDRPLFTDDKFETWDYGPVIRRIYDAFKKYEGKPITELYSEKGRIKVIDFTDTPIFKRIFDNVWQQCKQEDGIYLSKRTHEKGSAWYKSFQRDDKYLSDEDIMNDHISILKDVQYA